MKKLPVSQIPAALIKWSENLDDFWFGRFIRSLGYTRSELGKLMKKNKNVDHAVKLAFESLFEKVIYKIVNGYFKSDVGDFIMLFYGQKYDIIKKRELVNFKFDVPHDQDFSGLVEEEDNEPESEDEPEVPEGEFGPLVIFPKK